jgi:hypothetical protein
VVALADVTLWRSRDAGATFDVAAVLTSRAHGLALAADGETTLVADDDGVVEIGATGGVARRLAARVDALAACGAEVVALAGDGVHRLDGDGGDVLAGPRPPARALACGPEGLVAAGVGVWTSPDGARWREETAGLGRELAAVAWAAGHAWLAGARGLERLEAPAPVPDGEVEPAPSLTREESRRPPAWAAVLPRVALTYDRWIESAGVAGWRVWVLVTVSLDRRERRRLTTEDEEALR